MTGERVTVKVVDGYAVYDGEHQMGGGRELAVPADLAREWLSAGWVVRAEPKVPRKRTP